jgi:hypothetical protein
MERIRQIDLDYLVNQINQATKSPAACYAKKDGNILKANIGNYHLDYAYGGVKLVRIVNEQGGIKEISRDGYGTKRQLYSWLKAFLAGIATT